MSPEKVWSRNTVRPSLRVSWNQSLGNDARHDQANILTHIKRTRKTTPRNRAEKRFTGGEGQDSPIGRNRPVQKKNSTHPFLVIGPSTAKTIPTIEGSGVGRPAGSRLLQVRPSPTFWGAHCTSQARRSPARNPVPGPVVEVLVSDHALDALVVQVGRRLCTGAGAAV